MKKLKQSLLCGLFLTTALSGSVFADSLPTIQLHGYVYNQTKDTINTVTMGFPAAINSGQYPNYLVNLYEQPSIQLTYATAAGNGCLFDFEYKGKNTWNLTAKNIGSNYMCLVGNAAVSSITFDASQEMRLLVIQKT